MKSQTVGALLMSTLSAAGAERSTPLLSGDDLLAASRASITQGAVSADVGSIYYPDQILTVEASKASQSDPAADSRIEAWGKAYRFVVVPMTLAVQAKPGTAPRSVVVNAGFRNLGQLAKQPIIIDVFPATGFKAQPFQGSASVGIDAGLKFGGAAPANADAAVKASLSYSYAPAFANVQSGFASSACFWTFVASHDQQPVGALPLKLIVGVPRSGTGSLALAVDVVASYGSRWFGDDVRASFVTEVRLPP